MVDEEVEEVAEEIEEEAVETADEERNADANDGDRLRLHCSPLAIKLQKKYTRPAEFFSAECCSIQKNLAFLIPVHCPYIPFLFRVVIFFNCNPRTKHSRSHSR